MTITFTAEHKARLLRFLSEGMDPDDIADDFGHGCQRDHIIAIARNHGYPDRDKMAKAAGIIEDNIRRGLTQFPPTTPPSTRPVTGTPPVIGAQPTNLGDLLRHASQHPSKRIQAAAEHIIDRLTRLRTLIAEDDAKNAEKRRQAAEREAARAEVLRLEKELADARAALRPKTPPAPSRPRKASTPAGHPNATAASPKPKPAHCMSAAPTPTCS